MFIIEWGITNVREQNQPGLIFVTILLIAFNYEISNYRNFANRKNILIQKIIQRAFSNVCYLFHSWFLKHEFLHLADIKLDIFIHIQNKWTLSTARHLMSQSVCQPAHSMHTRWQHLSEFGRAQNLNRLKLLHGRETMKKFFGCEIDFEATIIDKQRTWRLQILSFSEGTEGYNGAFWIFYLCNIANFNAAMLLIRS